MSLMAQYTMVKKEEKEEKKKEEEEDVGPQRKTLRF